MIKRFTPLFSFGFISLLFFASAHLADASLCPTNQFAPLCNLKLENSDSIVGRVITILLIFAVIIALIFIILGGIRWITSGGDKAKVEGARGTITGAIIGLVVALLAYFILNVIMLLFTGNTITGFTIPTIVP